MSEDELIPYDLAGRPKYLVEWPAGLPHAPMWNLIPREVEGGSSECSWHGTIRGPRCEACHAEHAEYLETGTWEPRFNSYEEARAAADAEMDAYAAALPGRAQEIADKINRLLPDGMRFEWATASEDQAPDELAALGDSVALGFGDGIASAIRSAFEEQA